MAGEPLFPVGVPAGAGQVVDREAFIDEVVTRLADRQSVVLAGPRRTGKTSLGHEVLRRLEAADGTMTAAVDLATASSVRDLAERLTLACLENLSPGARVARRVRGGLDALLAQPEVRAKAYELEVSLALRREAERQPPERLLDEALALPQRMAAQAKRGFVVLFDEFQLIGGLGIPAILARMRGTFQLQSRCSFLFLGSHGGMLAHLFGARSQPFFRFATMLDVPPVPAEAWRAYIRERLGSRGVEIDDEALDVLLEQTGGHPYDTMRTAYEAHLLLARAHRLGASLMLGACARVQAQLAAVFDAEADAAGPRARAVLGRIAKGEGLYAGDRSKGAVALAIRALLAAGMLVRTGRGHYEFTERMMARHMGRGT